MKLDEIAYMLVDEDGHVIKSMERDVFACKSDADNKVFIRELEQDRNLRVVRVKVEEVPE